MRISVREARTRLATAGIELGQSLQERTASGKITGFQVTTPVGTEVFMRPRDVAGLLRDLNMLAAAS